MGFVPVRAESCARMAVPLAISALLASTFVFKVLENVFFKTFPGLELSHPRGALLQGSTWQLGYCFAAW